MPTSHGIDTYVDCSAHAADIKAAGVDFILGYWFDVKSFKHLLNHQDCVRYSDAGLWVGAIYQNSSDHATYFTAERGHTDAASAGNCSANAHQPAGKPVFFAVDFDASQADYDAHIKPYFQAVNAWVKASGATYTPGCYANGLICRLLKTDGLVTHTMLSQSTGYREHAAWVPHADIVQGPTKKLLHFDVDTDTAHGTSGCWQVS